ESSRNRLDACAHGMFLTRAANHLRGYWRAEHVVSQQTTEEQLPTRVQIARAPEGLVPVDRVFVLDEGGNVTDPFQLEPDVLRTVHAEQDKQVIPVEIQNLGAQELLRRRTIPQLRAVQRKREVRRFE